MAIMEGAWKMCARCGFPNDADSEVCQYCGKELDTELPTIVRRPE